MSGLDKIADSINREAQKKADDILAGAKNKAEAIEKEVAAKTEEFKRKSAERAERDADRIFERFASENRQQRKQALLRVRSEVIEDVVAEAKQKIISLPDGEYFDLMKDICVRNAQKGEGKLYFARADFSRLPKDFADKCNAEIQGGSVAVGDAVDTIQNGFIIVYGKVEQNCSLDSIFETNKNRIWDMVNASLSGA